MKDIQMSSLGSNIMASQLEAVISWRSLYRVQNLQV
jgi:hypothetical protein